MFETHLSTVNLSAIILTRNNADTIEQCIKSVSWVDEVLVYDSGSSDNTQAIADKAGASCIVDVDWSGFGKQRQKAQQHAKGKWLLWIDSDEVVTSALKSSIQQCLIGADNKQAFSINRATNFFGCFIKHSGWYPDRVVRLYARDHYRYNHAMVHEKVDCPAQAIIPLEGDLLHYTTPSFGSYMSKSLRYADDWAKQKYAKGKKVTIFGIILRSKFAFIRKYILQKGFLDGKHGLLLAIQSSHYTFNKYFALWILCNNKTSNRHYFHQDT